MYQREADEIIVHLRDITVDLKVVATKLQHGGFDKVADDIIDAMMSLFTASTRLQVFFPWEEKVRDGSKETGMVPRQGIES